MDIVRFVTEHIKIQETVSVKIRQFFRNTVVIHAAAFFGCTGPGPVLLPVLLLFLRASGRRFLWLRSSFRNCL